MKNETYEEFVEKFKPKKTTDEYKALEAKKEALRKAEEKYRIAYDWAYKKGITIDDTLSGFNPTRNCTERKQSLFCDGCFKPSKAVSRGDFVTFLWRFMGRPEAGGACDFVDIEAERYYYEAVLWAVERGITKEKTDKMFAPGLPCNRGEAVTFLCKI